MNVYVYNMVKGRGAMLYIIKNKVPKIQNLNILVDLLNWLRKNLSIC